MCDSGFRDDGKRGRRRNLPRGARRGYKVRDREQSNDSHGVLPFFLTLLLRSRMSCGKTALAEICVDGNGRVSRNSGSDVRKWGQPLTT